MSQLCNKDLDVTFKFTKCLIVNDDGELVFKAGRDRNIYTIELTSLTNQNVVFLSARSRGMTST